MCNCRSSDRTGFVRNRPELCHCETSGLCPETILFKIRSDKLCIPLPLFLFLFFYSKEVHSNFCHPCHHFREQWPHGRGWYPGMLLPPLGSPEALSDPPVFQMSRECMNLYFPSLCPELLLVAPAVNLNGLESSEGVSVEELPREVVLWPCLEGLS